MRFFFLNCSWFIILCLFQVYSEVIQLYIHIDTFFRFFSFTGYFKILNKVHCSIQYPNPCVCYMNSMPKFPTVHVFFGKLVAGMLLGFNGNSSSSSINFKKQHSNIIKCSCLDVVFCWDLVYCRTSLLECACSVVYDCLQPYKLLPARLLFHGILQARIL